MNPSIQRERAKPRQSVRLHEETVLRVLQLLRGTGDGGNFITANRYMVTKEKGPLCEAAASCDALPLGRPLNRAQRIEWIF